MSEGQDRIERVAKALYVEMRGTSQTDIDAEWPRLQKSERKYWLSAATVAVHAADANLDDFEIDQDLYTDPTWLECRHCDWQIRIHGADTLGDLVREAERHIATHEETQ